MEEVIINKNEEIVMKLLHYFITEKGYNPVILYGAKNEIWLENMESDYEIVRIVTGYIHNNEQLDFDILKTKQIMKKIKRKTFSFHIHALSLFTNIGDSVDLNRYNQDSLIDCANIVQIQDLNKYSFIIEEFPNITKETDFREKGFQLLMKITNDINKKNEEINKQAEAVFKMRKTLITPILIFLCCFMFFAMYIWGFGSDDNATLIHFGALVPSLIRSGEFYRLISCTFLHIGMVHLLCNMYCLYVVGTQIENFFGKIKFLIIYFFSALCGSLLSMATGEHIGAGASGAIFGLFGSLLVFGYHYRVYLGTVIRSQVIPLILLNLGLGFILSGIDNAAHIGGLVGGTLITMALGVKYKNQWSERINGIILSSIFLGFLIFVAFVYTV